MTNIIAQKFIPQNSFFGGNGLKQFLAEAETQTWNCDISPASLVTDAGKCTASNLVRLSAKPFELELLFSRLQTQDGKEIDLRIKTLCKVGKARVFLHEWKDRLDAVNYLTISDLEERVQNAVLPRFVDLIADHTHAQLASEHFLSVDSYHTFIDASQLVPVNFTPMSTSVSVDR